MVCGTGEMDGTSLPAVALASAPSGASGGRFLLVGRGMVDTVADLALCRNSSSDRNSRSTSQVGFEL